MLTYADVCCRYVYHCEIHDAAAAASAAAAAEDAIQQQEARGGGMHHAEAVAAPPPERDPPPHPPRAGEGHTAAMSLLEELLGASSGACGRMLTYADVC
jgi:hypothetical protein